MNGYISIYGNNKLLTYIWFLEDGKIDFHHRTIESKKGTFIMFPAEWFIPFKINIIFIIGNVFI
jgi:hypothetical protein